MSETPAAADLYCDLQPLEHVTRRQYLPGLLIAALATLSAAYLAERYGAPLTLMALLVGLALNFLSADKRLTPGLTFAAQTLLKMGIVLVGARVTAGQIVDLGPWSLLALISTMVVTVLTGLLAARALGAGPAFGTLAGGAVAICGASAAMALAAVLGERRVGQASLVIVLVGISAMSSLAMAAYPLVAHQLGFSDTQAGLMIGASVHDVAQTLGAGYSFSQSAGETAAIVKLARVALLAPALAIVARFFAGAGAGGGVTALPWFILGFGAMVGANSLGLIPPAAGEAAEEASSVLLACAVAATAIRAPMARLLEAGWRPMAVIVAASAAALLLAAVSAALLF